jgi:hypothetical protein
MGILARLVHDGQVTGEVRPGDPDASAHLYCVLVNEFVLLSADQAVATRSPPRSSTTCRRSASSTLTPTAGTSNSFLRLRLAG